jgi:hypothetical protein
MVLQLNFETYYGVGNPNNGLVHGLYVYTPQTDVLSLTWNNDFTVLTPVYNVALSRYEFGATTTPKDGLFTLTQNGTTKTYGYSSLQSTGSAIYGDRSSIIECDNGSYWLTNDLDDATLNLPTSSNYILSVTPDAGSLSGTEVFPLFNLDGTSTQGIQQVYFLGTGFSAGLNYNALFLAYNYAINPPYTFNSSYGSFLQNVPNVVACPTCTAGNNAPFLNSAYSNTCPSVTFDLSTLVASNQVSGTSLEFHNSNTPNSGTILSNLNVGVGTYYAVFHSIAPIDCYSSSKAIVININTCVTAIAVNHNETTTSNLPINKSVSTGSTDCNGNILT